MKWTWWMGLLLASCTGTAQRLGSEWHLTFDGAEVYGYEPSVTVNDKRQDVAANARVVIAWMTDYNDGGVVRYAYSTNRGVAWTLSPTILKGNDPNVNAKVYDPTMTGDRRGGRLVFG